MYKQFSQQLQLQFVAKPGEPLVCEIWRNHKNRYSKKSWLQSLDVGIPRLSIFLCWQSVGSGA